MQKRCHTWLLVPHCQFWHLLSSHWPHRPYCLWLHSSHSVDEKTVSTEIEMCWITSFKRMCDKDVLMQTVSTQHLSAVHCESHLTLLHDRCTALASWPKQKGSACVCVCVSVRGLSFLCKLVTHDVCVEVVFSIFTAAVVANLSHPLRVFR